MFLIVVNSNVKMEEIHMKKEYDYKVKVIETGESIENVDAIFLCLTGMTLAEFATYVSNEYEKEKANKTIAI